MDDVVKVSSGSAVDGSDDPRTLERSGLMAVPKRRMSRSNTRNRRSQWKAKLPELNTIRVAGREISVPRRLVKAYKTGLLEY